MYQRGSLIDDVKFMTLQEDESWIKQDIRSYQFYIKTGEEVYDVDDFEYQCKEREVYSAINDTTYTESYDCKNVKVGTHKEIEKLWEEYTLGTEVDAGTYEIKLEGEKKPSRTVDWQITSQGKLIDEWAVWGISTMIQDPFNDSSINASLWTQHNSPTAGTPAWVENGEYVQLSSASASGDWNAYTYLKSVPTWNLTDGMTATMKINNYVSGSRLTYLIIVDNDDSSNYVGYGVSHQNGATLSWGNGDIETRWWNFFNGTNNVFNENVWYEMNMTFNATTGVAELITNITTSPTSLTYSIPSLMDKNVSIVVGAVGRAAGGEHPAGRIKDLIVDNQLSYGFVTLNSPEDDYTSTINSVDFNCSATAIGVATLTNISLWHNGTGTWERNQTNDVTGTTNETIFTNYMEDGATLWTCEACDSDDDCGFATENRTVSVDSTAPVVTINAPTAELDYGYINKSETLNWSIVEAGTLDSVWYDYNTTNITSGGAENQTTFTVESYSNSNLTVYANDSANNEGNAFIDWEYKLWEVADSYSANTTEGSTESYYLNVTLKSGLQPSLVNLIYNGSTFNSTYPATITNIAGSNYTFSRTIEIPSVIATTNNSLFWEITLDDATKINTSSQLQSVIGLGIDNCTTHTNKLYNFTLVDEITQATFNAATYNASGKMNIQIYTLDRGTTVENLTFTQDNSNSYQVCLSTNLDGNAAFSLDLQLQYDADGYAQEFYHIQNATITSDSLGTNITVYDLPDTKTQEFVITYKADTFLPVADALIQIQRKYVDEGLFKTVEIPKTDVDGSTIAHLQLADAIYTFIIVKNGKVLGTFDNVLAVCQDIVLGNCDINLNSVSSTTTTEDFTSYDDLTLTLSYNETSRTLQSIFTVPSGTAKTMKLNATLYDNLGNTEICSDTLTSSSGTLSCVAPISFGNGSMRVILTSNNAVVGNALVKMDQTNRDIFGTSVIFLTMFLFMTLIGVGISDNPMITGAFLLIGVMLSVGLNLVNTGAYYGSGATILWVFIAIVMILIKGAKRT